MGVRFRKVAPCVNYLARGYFVPSDSLIAAAEADVSVAEALGHAATLLSELQMVEGAGRVLLALGKGDKDKKSTSTTAADTCRDLAHKLLPEFDEATWRATFHY